MTPPKYSEGTLPVYCQGAHSQAQEGVQAVQVLISREAVLFSEPGEVQVWWF